MKEMIAREIAFLKARGDPTGSLEAALKDNPVAWLIRCAQDVGARLQSASSIHDQRVGQVLIQHAANVEATFFRPTVDVVWDRFLESISLMCRRTGFTHSLTPTSVNVLYCGEIVALFQKRDGEIYSGTNHFTDEQELKGYMAHIIYTFLTEKR